MSLKVARDATNVYFWAKMREPLRGGKGGSPPPGLWLLIDADRDASTGWQGYDYVVNRVSEDGAPLLEKNAMGQWKWTKVARVDAHCDTPAGELQLMIPRASLGLGGGAKTSLDFKWADNLQRPGEVMDFYVSGDVAPEGRFMYRYEGE